MLKSMMSAPGRSALEHAAGAGDRIAQDRRVRKAAEDEAGVPRGVGGRGRRTGAALDQAGDGVGARVEDVELMARVEQPVGHAAAHAADADEGNAFADS